MSLNGDIHGSLSRFERVVDTLTIGSISRAKAAEVGAARLTESDWQSRYGEALFDLHSALQERAVALGTPKPKLDLGALFDAELPSDGRPDESVDPDAFLDYVDDFVGEAVEAIILVRSRAAAVTRGEYDAKIKAGVSIDDVMPDLERPALSDMAVSPLVPPKEHEGPSLSSDL